MNGATAAKAARWAFGIGGLALVIGAWPLAFLLAVIAGGGHSSPFGHSASEAVLGSAMLAMPAILLLIGFALLWASRSGRWQVAAGLALLIPIDIAVGFAALHEMRRPTPPIDLAPADAHAAVQGGVIVAIPSCVGGKCTEAPKPPR